MVVNINGKTHHSRGVAPRKPVRWSGKFLVGDENGNALEADWQPNSGGLMTYPEAREAAFNLIDSLTTTLGDQHQLPIKKIAFTLMCR